MARLLDRLVGHRDTLGSLVQAAGAERLAPTLLFSGRAGVGKRLAAQALAQALVCERDRQTACGECGPCLRIEKGASESLLQIAPDGTQIKIEQAREVLQFIALRTLGRARVVIIDQAHLLNPQAANALLKSLEEPPSATHFILVTPLAAGVLPTIRSRSQVVRFMPLSDQELRQVMGHETDEWVISSAGGSVESARNLLDHRNEFIEVEEAVAHYLATGVARLPVDEIAKLKELLKDRSAQGFACSIVQTVIRDALRARANAASSPKGRFPEIVQAIQSWPPEILTELGQLSIEIEQDLSRNVERGLVLENFAIQWRQAASHAERSRA